MNVQCQRSQVLVWILTSGVTRALVLAGEQISALSEAKAHLERPVRNARDMTAGSRLRNDGNKEYACLHDPYWQVRLSIPSAASRALAYDRAGVNPTLAVFVS